MADWPTGNLPSRLRPSNPCVSFLPYEPSTPYSWRMCLAIPGKILSITEEDPITRQGIVDFEGVQKEINLAFTPMAGPGEYVLVHVGFSISTIDAEEAGRVFEALRDLGELEELQEGSP